MRHLTCGERDILRDERRDAEPTMADDARYTRLMARLGLEWCGDSWTGETVLYRHGRVASKRDGRLADRISERCF